jgi:hypothetical protein
MMMMMMMKWTQSDKWWAILNVVANVSYQFLHFELESFNLEVINTT